MEKDKILQLMLEMSVISELLDQAIMFKEYQTKRK